MQSFKTNIKCGGCVSRVKPHLDGLEEIKSWNIDLESPDRILTVEGEIKDNTVINTIARAGYKAEKIQ
jgi:copper chaperone